MVSHIFSLLMRNYLGVSCDLFFYALTDNIHLYIDTSATRCTLYSDYAKNIFIDE